MKRGSLDIVERGKATRFKSGDAAAVNAAKKSAKARREKRSIQSTIRLLANTTLSQGEHYDIGKLESMTELVNDSGELTRNLTVEEVISMKIIQGALEDDAECRRLFLKLIGAMEN